MKIIPPVRSVLAALANTGAQRLQDIAHRLDPTLPDRVYVTGDLWCHLPDKQSLVLTRSSLPETVVSLTRYMGITIAKVADPHDDGLYVLVLLNHRETPYALYGRDPDGYPVDPEDYDVPRTHHQEEQPADMDALIQAAQKTPSYLN